MNDLHSSKRDIGFGCIVSILRISFEVVLLITQAEILIDRVQNSEIGVRNSEIGVQNSKSRVQNSEIDVRNLESRVRNSKVGVWNSESRVRNSKVGVWNSESRVQNSKVGVWNSESRVQNSEIGVQSLGFTFSLISLSPCPLAPLSQFNPNSSFNASGTLTAVSNPRTPSHCCFLPQVIFSILVSLRSAPPRMA